MGRLVVVVHVVGPTTNVVVLVGSVADVEGNYGGNPFLTHRWSFFGVNEGFCFASSEGFVAFRQRSRCYLSAACATIVQHDTRRALKALATVHQC